jgi:hemoglobin
LERCTAFGKHLTRVHTYSVLFLHKQLPVAKHFDRWMEIFTTTTDGVICWRIAEEAKLRAKNMAEMFNYKIDYFKMLLKTEIF